MDASISNIFRNNLILPSCQTAENRFALEIGKLLPILKAHFQFTHREMSANINLCRVVLRAVHTYFKAPLIPFHLTSKWDDIQTKFLFVDPGLMRIVCTKEDCKMLHETGSNQEHCTQCKTRLLKRSGLPIESIARVPAEFHLRLQLEDKHFRDCVHNPPKPTASTGESNIVDGFVP